MGSDFREDLALGKRAEYVSTYTPSLLQSVARADVREAHGIEEPLPFKGMDVWTAWELSWLNTRGRPETAVARVEVPATSPRMIESKSLKLYLNSFAQTEFASRADVLRTLDSDLMLAARAPVMVSLLTLEQVEGEGLSHFPGQSLDTVDADARHYEVRPELLELESDVIARESLHTHVLRTLCPVTGQPDVGSLYIQYTGPRISHRALLRYVISYREQAGFHEETVERMFMDLKARCRPTFLTVAARYLRRGGIDINPLRSTEDVSFPAARQTRQ